MFRCDLCFELYYLLVGGWFCFVSADESENDSGLIGKILIALSWVMVILTMPFSFCVCFKVNSQSHVCALSYKPTVFTVNWWLHVSDGRTIDRTRLGGATQRAYTHNTLERIVAERRPSSGRRLQDLGYSTCPPT
uniref:Uncharacterized protein n=1 Tax=Timema cristinae TaxID=61476 RepID=A0A7R9CVJ3_TIMCR|nr:unnamed protein product [Timema cristinae]